MSNSVTLKFLRVVSTVNTRLSFEAVLRMATQLGNPLARERNINAGFPTPIIVRLESLDERGDFVFGEMIRKQTDNIPPEANDDGLTAITLSDGAGLGLSSAFRYHLPTRVLLIQSNNQAVSQNRLALYLKAIDERAEFGFEPVARRDAWERFNKGVPRRLIMKIASPEHIQSLDNEAETIGTGVANIAEAFQGAYITIDVSMGRKQGSLAGEAVRRAIEGIRHAFYNKELDVRTLSASVTEEGEGSDLIDFLQEHLVVKEDLDLSERDPTKNYEVRRQFLETKYNEHFDYIRETFGG